MSPPAIKTPCRTCGKAAIGGYCDEHRKTAQRTEANTRHKRDRLAGYKTVRQTRRWGRVRRRVLARSPLCVECERLGRMEFATEVDHIIPEREAPELAFDVSNLQGLCKSCHSRKTAREMGFRKPMITKATIVCGPPGSGKNTYVDRHKRHGDVVIDLDALFVSLTGLPLYEKPATLLDYVMRLKDAAVGLLRQSEVKRAWIITGGATEAERTKYKRMAGTDDCVVLAVDGLECLKRIRNDPRRADRWKLWEPAVKRWWERFER